MSDLEFTDSDQPSTSGIRRSRKTSKSQQSTAPSPLLSSDSGTESKSFKELAAMALTTMSQTDQYTAFGDHVAAELRSLTAAQAAFAKRKLARALVDIMDEAVLMVSV